jgi:hypothetical protein
LQSRRERTQPDGVGDRWCSGGAWSLVLSVVLLSALDLHFMTRGPAVLDAVTYIDVGVDVLTEVH